ncbi:sensor histidine kinase [Tistrella mobilis]
MTLLRALRRTVDSFAVKLGILLVVFFSVPMILYDQFEEADRQQRTLLLDSVQRQGNLVAQALVPLLSAFDAAAVPRVRQTIERMAQPDVSIKLMLRPSNEANRNSFFYIASVPAVPVDYLQEERAELIETGVLDRLADTCGGGRPLAVEYTNPKGQVEVLTSLTPIDAPMGCWVVITAHATDGIVGQSLARPYWQMPEVRFAGAVYLTLALVVLWLFTSVWRNIRGFAGVARRIRKDPGTQRSFSEMNRVPELNDVARSFDDMVRDLRGTAETMRRTAEENAHAFKTPIAVISQSIEPLKRSIPADDLRGRRSLDLIERSVQRLDVLVNAARRIEETVADLLNPPRTPLNLSALLEDIVDEYQENARTTGDRRVVGRIDRNIPVRVGADMIETVMQNLLDNALSFTRPGTEVTVTATVADGRVRVLVDDQGPGVPPGDLERIFERYVSIRDDSQRMPGAGNFGIGLWIVRRNIEAAGGLIRAENRKEGGLRMAVELPLAR